MPEPTADNPSAGKRTIGRLRAQGVDVQDLLQKAKQQKWQLKQKAKQQKQGTKTSEPSAAAVTAGEPSATTPGKGKNQRKGAATNGNSTGAPIPAAATVDVEMGEPDLEEAMNG